jgi:hypothetical protein
MIRRDARLSDGSAAWMLVSQVEHARVSEQLAREHLGFADAAWTPVRDEVLAAIGHHDDGWEPWEQAPALDPVHGRPLAFTELDPCDAIAVWARSIEAAASIGPLAAWLVAGHFLRLLGKSDAPIEFSEVAAWQADATEQRRRWLTTWQRAAPEVHTQKVAGAALEALWTFDEASLWLCCTPIPDEPIPCAPTPHCAGRGTPWEMELRTTEPGEAVAQPWGFVTSEISVTIVGRMVPARRYRSAAALHAASAPARLTWRLVPLRR